MTTERAVVSRSLQSSTALFVVICSLIALFRSGVNSFGANESHLGFAAQWPDVEGYFRSSWLHFGLWHTLNFTANWQAVAYGALLTAGILAIVVWGSASIANPEQRRLAIALVVFSPIFTILLQHLGIYDASMIFGAALIACSRNVWLMALGSIVMVGSNFELGLVALVSFIALAYSDEVQVSRASALCSAGIGVAVSFVFLSLTFGNPLSGDSRSSWFEQHLKSSIVNSIVAFPLLVVSFYGAAWILIGKSLVDSKNLRNRILLLLSLLIVPSVAAFTTLDGTRVFVCASAPAFLTLIFRGRRPIEESMPKWVSPWNLVMASLLVPAVMVHFGEVKLPFQALYGRL